MCLQRWGRGWALRWTFKSPPAGSVYKRPSFKRGCFSVALKTSSAAYQSHIQMAGSKWDGFWLLSLCLLNCPFPKTIQLKPFVLYTPMIFLFLHIRSTNSRVFACSSQSEWSGSSRCSIYHRGCLCGYRYWGKADVALKKHLLRWTSFLGLGFLVLWIKEEEDDLL